VLVLSIRIRSLARPTTSSSAVLVSAGRSI
jgi:hypothetical protein